MTAAVSPQVRLLRGDEAASLPDPLARAVGLPGLDAWLSFVQKTYDFPVYRIVSEAGDEMDGWLALVRVRHFVFGDYLTTAPFASYGGFGYASTPARDALLEQARKLGRELGVHYVNVRFLSEQTVPPDGWVQYPAYATYLLDLTSDLQGLISAYSSDHRNHIRKSQKKGFVIKFGHLDLLDHAYEALARSMHELGSPYHSKAYLKTMARSLGGALEFAVLYDRRGEPAGGGVFLFQDGTVTNLHANILRRFRSDYAGEYLYWSALERYSCKGLKIFDLGRSLIGSGNEAFKMKWRPRTAPLAYWYALQPGNALPELNQKNPKFQLAIRAWMRLPSPVVRRLGPALIKGLA
jgi:FemAB-related protein (PEP-CTERM system-associated)